MCACIKPLSARKRSSRWNSREKKPTLSSAAVAAAVTSPGIAFPFIREKIRSGKSYRVVGVEPSACPTLTQGELRYDFGDTAETTPLMKMYTLGHNFMPPSIHAGGLRYHGMSPMVSHALQLGLMEAMAVPQTKAFEAGLLFARTEGLIPAPESSHAIAGVMAEAEKRRRPARNK